MGCTQSKVENEEAVLRCKQQKQYMKDAVTARNAFAAAHSSYITLLKNTGGALNDFGAGETTDVLVPGLTETPQILDPLPKPPPLPPGQEGFLEPAPIQRSASMPAIPLQQPAAGKRGGGSSSSPKRRGPTIAEDDDAELEEREYQVVEEAAVRPPPPPPRESNPPPPPPPSVSSPWEFFDILDLHGAQGRNSVEEPQLFEHKDEQEHTEIKQIDEEDDSVTGADDEEHKDDDTDAHESPVKAPEKAVRHSNSSNNKVVEPAPSKEDLPLAIQSQYGRVGVKSGKDLLKVFEEIDDHFLKASESGLDVSKMLEANRLHYHSNFANNNGLIDPERVKKVITWNSSFRENLVPGDRNDSMKEEERESHASVLDKLLAWEKKLYDEVKAGELMKIEYQKKIALLNRQKKRGSNSEALQKTKAAVKYLHTRYTVDFQSMDATSSEIRRLRDEQLYPKLVDLVSGLAKMWKTMYEHHRQQKEVIANVKNFDILNAPEETTKAHHDRTLQLLRVVNEWKQEFAKLVQYQKKYISDLSNWLRLNLIPIDSNLKEKVSSPRKTVSSPMHDLLQAWLSSLDRLSEHGVLEGIRGFAAAIENIVSQQEEELKQKMKSEAADAEYERKHKAFKEWKERYNKTQASEQMEANTKDPVMERESQLVILKNMKEAELEKYLKSCKATRTRSLNNLRSGLRMVFEALTSFSETSSEVYRDLHMLTSNSKPLENGQ